MEHIFYGYWWLIFPIMGFVFGGFGMYMRYRMHRDHMDLLRTYAEKGQTPPPEIAKAVEAAPYDDGYGYGAYRYRGRFRRGPYWEWRRVIVFICLAAGFGIAESWYGNGWDFKDGPGMPFGFLTILFGVLAAGSALFAILATVWRDK